MPVAIFRSCAIVGELLLVGLHAGSLRLTISGVKARLFGLSRERVSPRIMTFFRILKIKRSRLRRGFRLRIAPVSTELRRGKSPRQAIGHSSIFM
jgi:hypothetical protein